MGTTPTTPTDETGLPPAETPGITTFYCSQCGLVAHFLSLKVAKMTQPPICPIDSRQLKPIEQAESDRSL